MKTEAKSIILGLVTMTFGLAQAVRSGADSRQESALAERPPNVVFILADDLGYGDLGCYGATKVKTPNIDRLASEGLRFTDAHSPSAVCQPSRYALLSGRYNWRRGKEWDGKLYFQPGDITLPMMLKKQGYNTACLGKWHLGIGYEGPTDYNRALRPGPLEFGFDYYFGTIRTHNEPPGVFVEGHFVVGLDPADPIRIIPHAEVVKRGLKDYGWGLSEGGKKAHEARPVELIDAIVTDKALAWLDRQNKDTPFFVYLAYVQPHVPNKPSPRFKGSSDAGDYGDCVQELDDCVGRVLAKLESMGVRDDTLVFFASDNGALRLHDAVIAGHDANGGLLGQKTDAWEGGNRVPFMVRWPGRVPAGKVMDRMIGLTDVMATVAAACGFDVPDDGVTGVDSLNMLPLLEDPERSEPIRTSMVYKGIFGFGLRDRQWVYYPFPGSGGMTAHETIRWGLPYARLGLSNSNFTADGKLKPDAPKTQLYDVERDRGQHRNVVEQHPEVADGMAKQLADVLANRSQEQRK